MRNQINPIGAMKTKELIAEAISPPVEERALVVDSLLRSLNPTENSTEHVIPAWC
ncbi:hypothetical protein GWO14_21690 [candidate division KSB1 bacterium]|nr:hypothetical protein [candidate division KSB1 bacterium]